MPFFTVAELRQRGKMLSDEVAEDVKDDLLVRPNFPGSPKLRPRMPTRVGQPTQKRGDFTFKTARDGTSIAVRLPLAAAQKIAVKGGEPARDLHVTLVYLGDGDSILPEHLRDLKDRLGAICSHLEPLRGTITGYGRFRKDDDEDVIWCGLDSPDLPELRHKVLQACKDSAVEAEDDHGVTPPITLAYLASARGRAAMAPHLPV